MSQTTVIDMPGRSPGVGRGAIATLATSPGAVVAIGFAAVRWSRRDQPEAAQPQATDDSDLSERLDDELRNLD